LTDKATLMSAQMPETFESTAILVNNFCTGVQDARAKSVAEILPLECIKHGISQ